VKIQINSRASKCAAQAAGVFVLIILGYMSAVVFAMPIWAQQGCAWFGSRPFCDGQCPAGFVYTGQRESCTTGSRRFCCPAQMERVPPGSKNCKWVGNPGSMLFVCDDPEFVAWAAVAVDGKGRWGASIIPPSVNGPTKTADLARADALRRCGAGCKVVMAGKGRCVAVAQSQSGGYWVGYASGNDRATVQDIATRGCTDRAPPGSCRLEHVNCL
jgi:Domain of unknown function (DUF4189)